jgi:predicted RNase H-like nuclease
MTTFIGIDGIPRGWVAVYIDERRALRFCASARIDDLLSAPYDRAMVDIPIGLPERGYRQCDREAREFVGPSVFFGARWGVWAFPNHKAANEHYHSIGDKGISIQLWCLREKLKEVNEGMTAERQSLPLETHPELVFWRLNREHCDNLLPVSLANKKTAAGRAKS